MSLAQFVGKYGLQKVQPQAGNSLATVYYGQYRNFTLSVSVFQNANGLNNLVKVFGDFSEQEIKEKVNEVFNGLAVNKYIKNMSLDNSVYINLSKPLGGVKQEEFEFVLDTLHEAIGDLENVKSHCEFCRSTENNHMNIASDRVDPLYLCDACSNELGKKYESSNSEMQGAPNNYLQGILLGLVFSLGGVILWILIGMINFIAGIAGYAIAYLMYLGYKKAGGKLNKTAAVIIISFSLIMVVVATFLSVSVSLSSYYSVSMMDVMIELPSILAESSEAMLEFLKELGIGFLLTLAASYQLFRAMFQESKKNTLYVIR